MKFNSYLPPRYLFRRLEIFRNLNNDASNFLEVGAGNLALSEELLKKIESGVAIDLTPDLMESYQSLKKPLRKRLKVEQASFFDMKFKQSFDLVVACEVMEHITDDEAFLQLIHAALRPGGQAIVSVPAREKHWTIHDEIVGHLRRYEKKPLKELCERVGFDSVRIISYGYPWINLLSFLRVFLAKRAHSERVNWSGEDRTLKSNHRQIPNWLARSGIQFLVNPITITPLAWFSRLFNHSDLSDGYLILMNRSINTS